MELGEILRYEGYTPKLEELQWLSEEYDVDGTGEIGMREFFKIMRRFREEDLKRFRKLFEQCDRDGSNSISTSEIAVVLDRLGHKVSMTSVTEAVKSVDTDGSGDVDWDEFVYLMDKYRKLELDHKRKRCGFDDNQLYELTEMFKRYDTDGNNNLDSQEFMELLKDLKMAPRTELEQVHILKLLEDCREMAGESATFTQHSGFIGEDTDLLVSTMTVKEAKRKASNLFHCIGFTFEGEPTEVPVIIHFKSKGDIQGRDGWTSYKLQREGQTTFWVFLRLLRILEDDNDRNSLAVERKAAEKARFAADEVHEFREIFDHWHSRLKELGEGCGAATSGKALTSEGIARILRSLGLKLPAPSDYVELDAICKECDQDKNGNIDFPDFLVLMRWLLDMDFRKINEHIARPWP